MLYYILTIELEKVLRISGKVLRIENKTRKAYAPTRHGNFKRMKIYKILENALYRKTSKFHYFRSSISRNISVNLIRWYNR